MNYGATVERHGRALRVRLSDGQELLLTTAAAQVLLSALLTDAEVHRAWLHGSSR